MTGFFQAAPQYQKYKLLKPFFFVKLVFPLRGLEKIISQQGCMGNTQRTTLLNEMSQLTKSLILLAFVILLGTFGYMYLEGWELLDAAYMTVITLTTVGFGEVLPMDRTGRLFTIVLIFFGCGVFVFVAGAVVEFMVEGHIMSLLGRRKLDKKIKRLKDHYIVCGYGRIGRVLCQELLVNNPLDLVVIEKSPELLPLMEKDGVLFISGDASSEQNLIKAGIERARCLVAALATDTDNVFLVLTARQLNPNLFIMARTSYRESEKKLKAAGANVVESPYNMGATNMAHKLLRPTVTNFLDIALTREHKAIQMEEIPVSSASSLVNVMLKDSGIRQKYNLIIIAIKKESGEMFFNPSFETVFMPGDTVIAVGKDENLVQLEQALNPGGR